MKDTRNFDRAPLKDIRVKDNQVGIRTPQVLIKREGGEYMKGDILDANATTELAKSIHIPDIEKIKITRQMLCVFLTRIKSAMK